MEGDTVSLAPNPGPIVQVDPAQVDPLSSYSPAQQNPPPTPNELDRIADDPNQQPQYTAQGNELDTLEAQARAGGTTPPHQDPEVVAGAAHQSGLAKFMHSALDILGGTTTHRVVKDPDGTYSVHLDPSTTKEQWSRIAAAVLGGAAKGMAAGQGPGGAGKAVNAGFDQGVKQQQQQSDQATAEAKSQNENLAFKANHAMTDQQIAALTFSNQQNPIHSAQEAAEWDIKMQDLGGEMIANPKSVKDIAQFTKGNPNLMNGHFNTDGSVLVPLPQADGSLKVWRIPPDMAKRKYDKDFTYETPQLQPDGTLKNVKTTVYAWTKTGAEIALLTKQNILDSNAATKSFLEIQNQKKETALKENKDKREQEMLPLEKGQKQAQIGQAWSEVALNKSKKEVIDNTLAQKPGGTPTEVEDPRYPSPNNFPIGTIGIAPAPKGAAVPPTAAEAYRLKNIMQGSGNVIRQTVAANPQVFGKLQGLLSQGKTIVGLADTKDDLALATLAGSIQQYAAASAGFHKFRNKTMPAETEQSALAKFRNSPAAVVAYLDSQAPALKETDDLIKNYEVYHTPNGPSDEAREAAVRRAPNGAKFYPNAVGAPAPVNPAGQGATSNGTGGVAKPAPAIPPGKFAVRVNNQIVGYGDDPKGTNYHAF